MIGYKNTISGGSSIMQPIRIPENTRNVILLMNLIEPKNLVFVFQRELCILSFPCIQTVFVLLEFFARFSI